MTDINLQINRGRLLSELETIGNFIVYNDVNINRYNINGFLNFNASSLKLFGMAIDPNILLKYRPDIFNDFKKRQIREIDNFYEFLINNRELLLELFKNAEDFFVNDISFQQFPYYDCFKNYNEQSFKDLVLNFYSQYSDKYYNIVKKYFDENRIQTGYDTKDLAAMYIHSKLTSSGYIFLKDTKADSRTAASLVHELGHAISAETFVFPQQKNLGIFEDPYSEIPSTCFENLFTQQLIDKKIDYTGGLVLMNQLYTQIYNSSIINSSLLTMSEYSYDEDGKLYYSIVDDNNEIIEIDNYPIRDSLIYGLGHIIAIYFDKLDKKDRIQFLKAYNDIITSRKEYSFEELIKRLGISPNDFVELKYIKENIKDNDIKLRKRFNYHS